MYDLFYDKQLTPAHALLRYCLCPKEDLMVNYFKTVWEYLGPWGEALMKLQKAKLAAILILGLQYPHALLQLCTELNLHEGLFDSLFGCACQTFVWKVRRPLSPPPPPCALNQSLDMPF